MKASVKRYKNQQDSTKLNPVFSCLFLFTLLKLYCYIHELKSVLKKALSCTIAKLSISSFFKWSSFFQRRFAPL